jgi:lambda family phage portal protein
MSFLGWMRGENEPKLEAISGVRAQHETRWLGASRVVRSMADWFAKIGSGTSDLPASEQRTMRARSRDAFRSDLLARAVLTRARTNIVGTGLMCRPAVDFAALGMDQEAGEQLNADIQASWERWADDPVECDAEATLDVYGLQSLTLLSAMLSGDCFTLTPFEQRFGGISGLKVQIIEADRVENPNSEANRVGLIDGVVLTALGMPVGYWVRSNHPGDSIVTAQPATWTYFPAFGAETGRRRVLHVWNDKERPGQVRGAPYLAPILEPLRQLRRWTDNELMAAVISAMFTVFIEKSGEQLDENGNPIPFFGGPTSTIPTNPDGTQPDPSTFAPPPNAQNISLGGGAIVEGAPGDKFVSVNPARPNLRFDPFFVAMAKQIGAALEMPLDELMLQYNASYSAARAAMLQAWRFYLSRRTMLVQQFCQPLYGLWMDEEVASGRLALAGYADPIRRRAFSRAIWIGPARGSMDEYKEAQAAELRIDIGVSNEALEAAAMTGESRDSIYAQRLRESQSA